MGKLLLGSSFLILSLLLLFGLQASSSPVVWLTASSHGYTALRLVLMVVLLGLLAFGAPSGMKLRVLLCLSAVGLGVYTAEATYLNHMQLEDALAFVAASISIIIPILEPLPDVDSYELPAKATPVAEHRLAPSHS